MWKNSRFGSFAAFLKLHVLVASLSQHWIRRSGVRVHFSWWLLTSVTEVRMTWSLSLFVAIMLMTHAYGPTEIVSDVSGDDNYGNAGGIVICLGNDSGNDSGGINDGSEWQLGWAKIAVGHLITWYMKCLARVHETLRFCVGM